MKFVAFLLILPQIVSFRFAAHLIFRHLISDHISNFFYQITPRAECTGFRGILLLILFLFLFLYSLILSARFRGILLLVPIHFLYSLNLLE